MGHCLCKSYYIKVLAAVFFAQMIRNRVVHQPDEEKSEARDGKEQQGEALELLCRRISHFESGTFLGGNRVR